MTALPDQFKGIERMISPVTLRGLLKVVDASARRATLVLFLTASAIAQPKTSTSPFREAENLLEQHRLAEARTETLEQLKTHP